MSSSRPPQLHLELPTNTTSFKRSFEEFGFDLESPLGGVEVGGSGSDGNDRNKRARSTGSFSDDEVSVGSSSSSTISSSSASTSSERAPLGRAAARPAAAVAVPVFSLSVSRTALEPPRLPTPELQDINMTDYPLVHTREAEEQTASNSTAPTIPSGPSQHEDSYRLSLERFNAFDSQIAVLRRSPSPRLRSPTPPPILPPLALLNGSPQLAANFIRSPARPPSLPLLDLFSDLSPPRRGNTHDQVRRDDAPRASSHESNTRPESFTSTRDSDSDPTSDTRPPDTNLRWGFWPPAIEVDDEDVVEEEEEGEDEPVDVFFRRAIIDPLRSPSPLFEDLEDLEGPQESSVARTVVPPTPPTLPPIADTWDDPLVSLRSYSLNSPGGGSTMPDDISQALPTATSRIVTAAESHTVPSGSVQIVPNQYPPSLPSPDVGPLVGDDLGIELSTSTASTMITRESSTSAQAPSSGTNAGAANSRSARIEALNELRDALHGIGRVLRENNEHSLDLFDDLASPRTVDNTQGPPSDSNYLGDIWRSGFAEGFASALSTDIPGINTSDTVDAGQNARLPRPSDGPIRSWLPNPDRLNNLGRPTSPTPPRSGQLSEEYMNIVRRDSGVELRSLAQQATDSSREMEARASRVLAAERLVPPFNSDEWLGIRRQLGPSDPDSSAPQVRIGSAVVASPALYTGSSRLWPWEGSTAVETGNTSTTESIPSLSSAPFLPDLLSLATRRPRLQERATNLGRFNATDFASGVPGQEPISSQTFDTGIFGSRQVHQFPPPASSMRVTSSFGAPGNLSRFRSRQSTALPDNSTHARLDSRPTSTETVFDARRRDARLELFERQRRPLQQSATRSSSESRPSETQNRFPSVSSSLTSRFLPDPRRRSPVRVPLRHRDPASSSGSRSNRSTTHQSLLDFTAFADDSYEDLADAMDVERNVNHDGNAFTPRVTDAFDTSQVGGRVEAEEYPRVVPQRSRVSSVNGRSVDSLRQEHQDTRRSLPGVGSANLEGPGQYLASPALPSPGLGDFDFDIHSLPGRPGSQRMNTERSSSPERLPPFTRLPPRRRSPSPVPIPPSATRPTQMHLPPMHVSNVVGVAMDPNGYAPGPFRNTVQSIYEAHMANQNRANGHPNQQPTRPSSPPPPVIPPLAFEDELSTLYDSQQEGNPYSRQRPALPPRLPRSFRHLTEDLVSMSSDSDEDSSFPTLPPLQHRPQPQAARFRNPDMLSESSRRFLSHLEGTSRYPESRLEPLANRGLPTQPQDGPHPPFPLLRYDRPNLNRSQEIVNQRRDQERTSARNLLAENANAPRYWGQFERQSAPSSQMRRPAGGESQWRHNDPSEILARLDAETSFMASATPDERARLLASHRGRRNRRNADALNNPPELLRAFRARTVPLGDYMRDEDFDASYEGLLSLAARIGEVKPRSTPANVIEKMETGMYKDWKTAESDVRCPICLDDYKPDDMLMRPNDCSHWLHRECLHKWLKGASTCPVCRKAVGGEPRSNNPNETGSSWRRRDAPDDERTDFLSFRGFARGWTGAGRSGAGGGWMPPPWRFGQGD